MNNGPRPFGEREAPAGTEEGTVSRVEESQEVIGWAKSLLASDGDLLSKVLRLGLELGGATESGEEPGRDAG